MISAAPMNRAVLNAFGRPVTLRHLKTERAVTGVVELAADRFNNPGGSGGPGNYSNEGMVLEKNDAILSAPTADVTASGIVAGDQVLVGGVTYRVVDVLDDRDGMRELFIRMMGR